MNKAF